MFVSIEIDKNKRISVKEERQAITFKELGLRETDIEEFLRKNIDLICDGEQSLLIIGQQVKNKARGRSDLTAVDGNGDLVLIELKRDKDDVESRREALEFQAIRYAASYAKIATTDELVDKIFAPYIEKHRNEFDLAELTANEKGKRLLNDFLDKNGARNSFNNKQRIILVASEFDEQTLSAVSWLIANDVDISCYRVVPAKIQSLLYLEIERLLPVAKLSDYYVDIHVTPDGSKFDVVDRKVERTYLPRMDKLFEWGIIKAGDIVYIKNYEGEEAEVVNSTYVKYKGEKRSFNQWAKDVTGWSSICVYDWTIMKGQTETLSELRKKRLDEEKSKEKA